ncbi:chromosome partitioning protein [Salinibacter sp. 10B]|uniref:nucleotide-binding protein n=1 Tax=Salinibacter sp. 10B TaxID=1923971 RepID=UPI000CF48330|nr:AAA family ATPase [Salinibacter sp. 10B]PQJ26988.1 chromosome partitioning protein [Salinibacter sp. 10B]
MVILIGGEKGGTGKTTLATNLAALRSNEGRDVLLVDTDKQGSASDWAAVREEIEGVPRIPSVQVFGKQVTSQVQDLEARYDDLIVDAGGRDSVELRSAMVVTDRFYVPLQASQFDVWTIERMEELVEQAQAINPSLQARVFINRASPHPQVREASEAEEILEEFEHLVFSGVVLHDRIAFRRAAGNGVAVTETESPDPKACNEVQALYDAIFEQTETAHAQEA